MRQKSYCLLTVIKDTVSFYLMLQTITTSRSFSYFLVRVSLLLEFLLHGLCRDILNLIKTEATHVQLHIINTEILVAIFERMIPEDYLLF